LSLLFTSTSFCSLIVFTEDGDVDDAVFACFDGEVVANNFVIFLFFLLLITVIGIVFIFLDDDSPCSRADINSDAELSAAIIFLFLFNIFQCFYYVDDVMNMFDDV